MTHQDLILNPFPQNKNIKSLYIHFPYCETKCHYCDFFSLPISSQSETEKSRAYAALINDLKFNLDHLHKPLRTVFLGGGTPSLAPLEIHKEVFQTLINHLDSETEITIEANPSSIDHSKTIEWKTLGINRVSMGLQALDNTRLQWLGRVHTQQKAFEALEAIVAAGFSRISVDYIVGVPGLTPQLIREELSNLLKKFPEIDHVSAYLLTLKPSNPKFAQLPNEEIQLEHLRQVSDVLHDFNFDQYEISNFARAQSRARHNENYWLGGSYLGIGPSAHSYFADHKARIKNWGSLGKYCEKIESQTPPIEWQEILNDEQLRLEYLLLNLRRKEGLDIEDYKRRFSKDLVKTNAKRFETWQTQGLCQIDTSSNRFKLTRDGFFLSDQIISNIE